MNSITVTWPQHCNASFLSFHWTTGWAWLRCYEQHKWWKIKNKIMILVGHQMVERCNFRQSRFLLIGEIWSLKRKSNIHKSHLDVPTAWLISKLHSSGASLTAACQQWWGKNGKQQRTEAVRGLSSEEKRKQGRKGSAEDRETIFFMLVDCIHYNNNNNKLYVYFFLPSHMCRYMILVGTLSPTT